VSFDAYVYVEHWSVADRPMALLVQLQMANRAHKDTGMIEVSHADLAADCRFKSSSAVDRHLRYLVRIGEVEVVDPGKRGRGHRATYRFPRMAAPPTPAERAAAAKRPPPRVFNAATTLSGDNGKDLEKTSTEGFSPNRYARASSLNPSLVTDQSSTHPESNNHQTTEREGKAQRPRRAPRRPRHPEDPFVRDRVEQIRTTQGPAAAAAYLRTVGARFEPEERAAMLRRLEERMTPAELAEAERMRHDPSRRWGGPAP
jgi:hypothetical protein